MLVSREFGSNELANFNGKKTVKCIRRLVFSSFTRQYRSDCTIYSQWTCACACFSKGDVEEKEATCSADSVGPSVLSAYRVT